MSIVVWKEQNDTIESLKQQLAESQATNGKLREALERNKRGLDAVYALQSKWHLIGIDARETSRLWDEIRNLEAITAMGIQALALPSDATALNELIAERTKELTAEVERLKAITFPVNIDYGDGPEEVAYGNEHQVRRLKKWLDKYFQLRQQLAELSELNNNHAFNAKHFKVEFETAVQKLAEKDAEIVFQQSAHEQAQQLLLEQGMQLAAAQAQIVGYRDDLQVIRLATCDYQVGAKASLVAANKLATKALAQPQDTSALEAIVKQAGEVMRERCAAIPYGPDITFDEIRALPGVTIADLKP